MNKFAEIWMWVWIAIPIIGLIIFGEIALQFRIEWCGYVALFSQIGWVFAPYGMVIEEIADRRKKGGKK